ncbi:hypothetical protein NPIL_276311 [Nephila pilipes]|uniref:Uncharacterized protein n=1 Tax=Nephila pilipes TaxID=299642 RepID=A0A8X6UAY7_NEPPI|nr:hypothetical protein NPIL_276311 [Nephila pilipes]
MSKVKVRLTVLTNEGKRQGLLRTVKTVVCQYASYAISPVKPIVVFSCRIYTLVSLAQLYFRWCRSQRFDTIAITPFWSAFACLGLSSFEDLQRHESETLMYDMRSAVLMRLAAPCAY